MFARYPPLTNLKRFMMRQMFVVPLGFSRPVSVEAERAARKRTKVVKLLALALVIVTAGYFGPSLGVRFGGWY